MEEFVLAAAGQKVTWFVERTGCRHGPLTTVELALMAKLGHLGEQDRIWCDGLPDYVVAGTVPGLLAPKSAATPQPSTGLIQAPPSSSHMLQTPRPAQGAPVETFASPVSAPSHTRTDNNAGENRSMLDLFNAQIATRAHASNIAAPPSTCSETETPISDPICASPVPRANPIATPQPPNDLPGPIVNLPALNEAPISHALSAEPGNKSAANPIGFASHIGAGLNVLKRKTAAVSQGVKDAQLWQKSSNGLESVGSLLHSGLQKASTLAPAQLQQVADHMQAYNWDDLIELIVQAFERNNIKTLDDLMDETRMRDIANCVYGELPLTIRLGFSMTIGKQGFEQRFLSSVGWVRQQIGEQSRSADISPLIRQLLRSDNIKRQVGRLFADLKTSIANAVAAHIPATASQIGVAPALGIDYGGQKISTG